VLYEKGIITPLVLVIASVMFVFAAALINWSVSEHKDASRKIKTTQALQISEAGVNYYKWHLEHDENDYQDGKDWCCDGDPDKSLSECGGVCGPYDREYRDYCSGSDCEGNIIGRFSLRITPPEIGSTIVTVESNGYAYSDINNKKEITARVGKRSLAEYSWFSDAPMTFSVTSEVSGPVHSNDQIEFRGVCSAEITSHIEFKNGKDGVWGSGGPKSFWHFPVARVNFNNFLTDFNKIKTAAAMDDAVLPETIGTCNGDSGEGRGICYEGSGKRGYLVKFNDNATVSIYKVMSVFANPNKERIKHLSAPLLENHPMPDNGLIFLGDDVWVEGTVNGKVTVAATKLWSGGGTARMVINDSITYADGRAGGDNLGLICEDDIIIPKHAPDTLIVDASLLSQHGKGLYFGWYFPFAKKDYIENYGGIITYEQTGIKWGNPVYNGYEISKYIFNSNLSFSPPPFFPTSENFEVLSWSEN